MAEHSRAGVVRAVFFSGCSAVIMLLVLGPLASSLTGQVESSPVATLVGLGLKFDGAQTCDGAKCHGKPGNDIPPTEPGHEYTIWAGQDEHRNAFKTLLESESKAIGEKLKIADVATSAACTSCHALSVPKELQGDKFSIREGNTCGNCHGPSEKWMKPHAEETWKQQRDKFQANHEGLLKEWGLFDTKPLSARADLCVGCHLAIDADMVAAGHPQTTFELDWYHELEPKHWRDPEQPYFSTKVWLAGQVAALRDSMNQLAMRANEKKSPEMVKSAYQQAMSHLLVLKPAASAAGLDAGALDEAAKALISAVSDPAANADAIAGKAASVAAMADGALKKIDSVEPSRQMTVSTLSAIAAADGMAKDCGHFGMEQQAWAIRALYNAYAGAEKVADAERDAMLDLIETKLLPPEEGEPNADDYAKALGEVKGKLPK